MPNQISSLFSRVRKHYSRYGLLSLIKSGVEKPIQKLAKKRALSRVELQRIAAERDAIWYMPQEDPINISSLSHPTLKKAFEPYPKAYTPDQAFICELKDCHLIGPDAIGLTNNGKFIQETASGEFPRASSLKPVKSTFYKKSLGLRARSSEISSESIVFPLISEYHSYYHWMVEYLPKLRLLEYYQSNAKRKPTILIESDPREFVQDTLSVVGHSSMCYEEWNNTECHVENLVVPIHRSHRFDYENPERSDYNPSCQDLLWLRERARSNVVPDTSRDRNIIYISRQNVPKERGRKVINHDKLINIVHEFGGDEYILEEMTFEEQVKLFADSDMIIGPHGAGLVNMIFADNPTVVELFPETVLKPHFYFIADIMGFDYAPIVTDSSDDNLVIDEQNFREHIKSLLDTA